jgi:hypothetical protein
MRSAEEPLAAKRFELGLQIIEKIGAPERSRTPNPQIRSLVLYPIELRAPAECVAAMRGGHNYSTAFGEGKAHHYAAWWPAVIAETT